MSNYREIMAPKYESYDYDFVWKMNFRNENYVFGILLFYQDNSENFLTGINITFMRTMKTIPNFSLVIAHFE